MITQGSFTHFIFFSIFGEQAPPLLNKFLRQRCDVQDCELILTKFCRSVGNRKIFYIYNIGYLRNLRRHPVIYLAWVEPIWSLLCISQPKRCFAHLRTEPQMNLLMKILISTHSIRTSWQYCRSICEVFLVKINRNLTSFGVFLNHTTWLEIHTYNWN